MPALPIGGFMPIPLAMMIPFMAVQSMIMGDAFGKGYQFGKRKISAKSNDEFNSLQLSDLITEMQVDFKHAIPKIEESIQDSTKLQSTIIREMLLIVPKFFIANTQGSTSAKVITGKSDEITALDLLKTLLGPLGSTLIPTPANADTGNTSPPSTNKGGAGIADIIAKSQPQTAGEPNKFGLSDLSHDALLELQKYRKSYGPEYQAELSYWIKRTSPTTPSTTSLRNPTHVKIDTVLSDWLAEFNKDLELILSYKKQYKDNPSNARIRDTSARQFSKLKGELIQFVNRSGQHLAGVPNANQTRNNLLSMMRNLHI